MRIISRILKVIVGIITMFAMLLVIPKCFGISPMVVLSGSMEPEIRTGSVVYVNTNDLTPELGKVITYRISEKMVTHRVIRIEGETVITKGDANEMEDAAPVSISQIVGTPLVAIPYLGYVANLLQAKGIVFIVLALILLSTLLDSLCEEKPQISTKVESEGEPFPMNQKKI